MGIITAIFMYLAVGLLDNLNEFSVISEEAKRVEAKK